MAYSFRQGVERSLTRAVKIGVATFAVAAVGSIAAILPPDYVWIAPLLATLVGFFEKLERNYREVKREE